MPPEYEPADVSALQAMARGDASEAQQLRALDWIINKACGTYDFPFRPDPRSTDLVLGRMFVGQQIVKLLHLNAGRLTGQTSTEQG